MIQYLSKIYAKNSMVFCVKNVISRRWSKSYFNLHTQASRRFVTVRATQMKARVFGGRKIYSSLSNQLYHARKAFVRGQVKISRDLFARRQATRFWGTPPRASAENTSGRDDRDPLSTPSTRPNACMCAGRAPLIPPFRNALQKVGP